MSLERQLSALISGFIRVRELQGSHLIHWPPRSAENDPEELQRAAFNTERSLQGHLDASPPVFPGISPYQMSPGCFAGSF